MALSVPGKKENIRVLFLHKRCIHVLISHLGMRLQFPLYDKLHTNVEVFLIMSHYLCTWLWIEQFGPEIFRVTYVIVEVTSNLRSVKECTDKDTAKG